MKYKTVKDILCDVFTKAEINMEGINEFNGATDRIHDNRPYPHGTKKEYYYQFMHSDLEKLPFPSEEKKIRFKKLARNFKDEHPHIDIYQDTNEVEHCAIRGMYY